MVEFAKGIKVKSNKTQYGEIIKLGINTKEFFENPINENGWLNLDIKKSKNDKWYAEINTYKKPDGTQEVDTQDIVESLEGLEDEIPF